MQGPTQYPLTTKFTMPPRPEKRVEDRVPTRAYPVKVIGECQRLYGYARDISRSGMQIRTFYLCESGPKKVGDTLKLEFRLPEKGISFDCDARVMWNFVPPDGPASMQLQGVMFEGITQSVKKKIDEWAKAIRPEEARALKKSQNPWD